MESNAAHKDGNRLFEEGDLSGAEAKYSQAIEEYEQAGSTADKLRSMSLSNRSLTREKLGKLEEALVDAEASIKADELYVKAHLRKATALAGMERKWEARRALREAMALFESKGVRDALVFLAKKIREMNEECKVDDVTKTVESIEHWKEIAAFAPNKDARLRLATMATFWNSCSQGERKIIMKEFFAVLTGNPQVKENKDLDVPEDQMIPLPMENYADVDIPETWTAFFTGLPFEDKVTVFNDMYHLCSKEEKNLVSRDLTNFFQLARQNANSVPSTTSAPPPPQPDIQ